MVKTEYIYIYNYDILESSIKSPWLHPVFRPHFTPIPSFSGIPKVMKFYSAFNAQGSIIVIVEIGVVKMYVVAVVRKKEGRMKLSLPPNQASSPLPLLLEC
jgi:hypothetical protein